MVSPKRVAELVEAEKMLLVFAAMEEGLSCSADRCAATNTSMAFLYVKFVMARGAGFKTDPIDERLRDRSVWGQEWRTSLIACGGQQMRSHAGESGKELMG